MTFFRAINGLDPLRVGTLWMGLLYLISKANQREGKKWCTNIESNLDHLVHRRVCYPLSNFFSLESMKPRCMWSKRAKSTWGPWFNARFIGSIVLFHPCLILIAAMNVRQRSNQRVTFSAEHWETRRWEYNCWPCNLTGNGKDNIDYCLQISHSASLADLSLAPAHHFDIKLWT